MKQYYYQRKEVNYKMAQIDLTKYGITGTTEIVYNPSYEQLFEEETKPELEGYEKGRETELGAVNVMTGIYTGRSPKDKYIVVDENSKDTVWWTSDEYKNDNHPATQEAWAAVKEIAKKELSNKRLFVVDAFCGANKDTRMAIRFIVEVAWQAHFVTNMFIKPTAEELENFEPDFVVYNASKAKVENYKELGLNSETAVVFNITSREQVIINTWYGGEMKKGMFSMMNYYLPLKGIASMHCSANTDLNGENTAIFFGLSGTGKTTLSTDPKRLLIGDDGGFILRHLDLHPLEILHFEGTLIEHVDDAGDFLVLVPDGHYDGGDLLAETLPQRIEGGVVVAVFLVGLGDIDKARHVPLLAVFPDFFKPHGNAVLGGADDDGGVSGPQGLHHLAGKIKGARGVQQVDLAALVLQGGHGGGNRNLPADLLGVIVADGVAVSAGTHALEGTGHEQQALGQGGLAAAAVAQKADVADVLHGIAHSDVLSLFQIAQEGENPHPVPRRSGMLHGDGTSIQHE